MAQQPGYGYPDYPPPQQQGYPPPQQQGYPPVQQPSQAQQQSTNVNVVMQQPQVYIYVIQLLCIIRHMWCRFYLINIVSSLSLTANSCSTGT